MPPNAPDRDDGTARRSGEPARRPLPEIRQQVRGHPSPVREQIMAATLAATGELGYRKTRVNDVLGRYDGYRLQFYEHFANLGECYVEAHAAHAQRLERRLLAAGAAADAWRAGLRAALGELARFVGEDPPLARGLLVEVHVAGGPALTKRQEVFERLSRAIDSARRETGSRHSPPPLTAPFMVSAIEATVVRALLTDETRQLEQRLGEVEHLVAAPYF